MTNEQAKKMLKAKLECLKRETSGTDFDCNNSNCDECSLCYEQGNMGEQKEALDMAIKALEQQPCEEYNYKALWEQVKWERDVATEQLEQLGYSLGEKIRTSEDCISRQYLIEKATSWDKHFADSERYVSLTDIQKTPSVTPQPKRGHWIAMSEGFSPYECSECESVEFKKSKYCPNCGCYCGGDDKKEVQDEQW